MGVRLDMDLADSEIGIDIPGSEWMGFFVAVSRVIGARAPGTHGSFPVIREGILPSGEPIPPSYVGELQAELAVLVSILPDGPDFAEGAHRALALRIARLAKSASAAGVGLVWS